MLPPQAAPLAAPVAGALRQVATGATQEVLSRPAAQGLWEDANRTAHERLIALIDDEGEFVATTGGTVTLDLNSIIGEVVATIGLNPDIVDKLPAGASEIKLMESDELDLAQKGVKLLRTLAWFLTALALALYALRDLSGARPPPRDPAGRRLLVHLRRRARADRAVRRRAARSPIRSARPRRPTRPFSTPGRSGPRC